jgi:pyridoxamine 5'-phosphate oxidase
MSAGKRIDHRMDYTKSSLDGSTIGSDPLALFGEWLQAAMDDGLPEPHAMTLSTAGTYSISSRVVLLRSFDARGFVFYTNHNSRKAMDLERDPRAALLFFWPDHERQVRIEGKAEHVPEEESDAYFASRPRESRIGAWCSDQSRAIADRAQLEQRYARWEERFQGQEDIPRPLHWGGWVVRPVRMEFWQGRPSRLHDRIVFEHFSGQGWERMRLQP